MDWLDEPVLGHPKRAVLRDEAAAKEPKARTLTNLYNACPQCLADVHAALDAVVAVACGWTADIPMDKALPALHSINTDTHLDQRVRKKV